MNAPQKKNTPTEEQVIAIDFSNNMKSFKIAAYAGAGKTSTLAKISENLFEKFNYRGVYLAFNKAIAEEAKIKLHNSVECRTFHSFAFEKVGKALTSKISYKKTYPNTLAEQYGAVDVPIPVDEDTFEKYIKFKKSKVKQHVNDLSSTEHIFTAEMQMQAVNDSIKAFCSSVDDYINTTHIVMPEWVTKNESLLETIKMTLLAYCKKRWLELIDTSNNVGITHDVYVKVWAMTQPKIEADYILFDESQDADAIQLMVLKNQDCPVIYVGDKYQEIYGWRGAINAMEELDIPEIKLTKSFRFGTEVAVFANKFISLLGEVVPLRGHSPIHSKVSVLNEKEILPDAILCRSNKGAFSELINAIRMNDGRKYALQANTVEIIDFLKNAKKLKNKEQTNHIELDNFLTWEHLEEYTELNPTDQNVSGLVRIINEFEDIDLLVNTLKESQNINDADCIICTAHKSKGLEWDNVKISDDFNLALFEKSELEENLANLCHMFDEDDDLNEIMPELKSSITKMADSEIRLLYVAITRAKKELNIFNIKEFFDTYDYALNYFFENLSERDLKTTLF